MTERILDDVSKERERQEKLHHDLPKYIRHPVAYSEQVFNISESLKYMLDRNGKREEQHEESWYGICMEELLEVFAEEDIERIRGELVHSVAIQMRMIEAIDSGKIL